MKLWGICSHCERFPGRTPHTEGCPIKKHPDDGKYHLSDFQLLAKCESVLEGTKSNASN